jgi:hypothetical protein
VLTRICILVAVIAAGQAWAEAGPAAARIAVDFARPDDGQQWFVAGLEELVASELQRFHQVKLAEKLDAGICPGRGTACLVEGYRRAGVELVVVGRLRGPRLEYEVYPTWTRSRAFDGALAITGGSTVSVQRHVGDILRPIIQRGGLLDQRPAAVEAAAPAAAAVEPGRVRTFGWVLVGLIALLAWPIVMLFLLVGSHELGRRTWPASWKWSALFIVGTATVLVATGGDHRAIVAYELPDGLRAMWERILPIAAGMLWGSFAWVHVRWAFAPIHGLGGVRHDALWTLLRSWLALSLLRVLLLGAYAPVVMLTLDGSEALAFSSRATWALAMPAAGLFACFWLLTLIDNLAVYLDVRLVVGPATDRNPWHCTMRRYFLGYLKRNGVEVGAHVLDRTLFLPSNVELVSYGGGFARPRVAVGSTARIFALGELPDEREAPERQVNPEELAAGVIVPAQGDGRDAARAKLTATRRRALTGAAPRRSIPKPKLIGEHLTLLGWVLPQPPTTGSPSSPRRRRSTRWSRRCSRSTTRRSRSTSTTKRSTTPIRRRRTFCSAR